jgi:hypothetical protein
MCRRPLSSVFGQLRDAGFVIDQVDEPMPEVGDDETKSRVVQILRTMPVFLFVKAISDRDNLSKVTAPNAADA